MNAKHITTILSCSLLALLLGMGGGTYIIAKSLKGQATKLSTERAEVEQLTAQVQGIGKSKRDIATYSELEAITKSIVPQDKDQAATVREITKLADASKVPLTTITFPSST